MNYLSWMAFALALILDASAVQAVGPGNAEL